MSEFYRFPAAGDRNRTDPCTLCDVRTGSLVGRVNYVGLGEWDVLQCPGCGLVSLDPMPGLDVIQQGCNRLYIAQQSTQSRRRALKYFARSYRRGGHFALHYLRQLSLCDAPAILEVGAGNGYFSQGVKRIYPQAKVHYLDVMEDLLIYYRKHFDCEAVAGEFSAATFPDRRFDLIIARDILEHVRDPLQMLHDAHALLNPGGHLFFITPNGREDFWTCNQRFIHSEAATLIWQNHFHCYLPETLRRMLSAAGLVEEIAFKWNLDLHRKGMGHAEMPGLRAEPLPHFEQKSAPEPPSVKWLHESAEVTSSWRHNLGWRSRIYSEIIDRHKNQVEYTDARGKEFFVIARKQQ